MTLYRECGAVWRIERARELKRSLYGTSAALPGDDLSARERQVARLTVDGLTAREIGEQLFISRRTVETHLANVYAKLGVRSKIELVGRASELATESVTRLRNSTDHQPAGRGPSFDVQTSPLCATATPTRRSESCAYLRSKKKWGVAIVGVAVVGTSAAIALGSAAIGFTPTTLVTGAFNNTVDVNQDRIKFQTKDPTDVRIQKIVFDAGGNSGWHHHPGVVIATVMSGSVTFTKSDCSSTTYGPGLPAGAVFIESGDQPGEASSVDGATSYLAYVVPSRRPARLPDRGHPAALRHYPVRRVG